MVFQNLEPVRNYFLVFLCPLLIKDDLPAVHAKRDLAMLTGQVLAPDEVVFADDAIAAEAELKLLGLLEQLLLLKGGLAVLVKLPYLLQFHLGVQVSHVSFARHGGLAVILQDEPDVRE